MNELRIAQRPGALGRGRVGDFAPWLRARAAWLLAALRKLLSAPLELRFLAFSVVVLVAGALVIGGWTAREIKARVVQRAAAVNALYVDSFVSPLLQPLGAGRALPAGSVASLDGLLTNTALGEKIVSFKIWSPAGEVLYAMDDRLVGRSFPVTARLRKAAAGEVSAQMSKLGDEENQFEEGRWGQLLETYAPVRSHQTGRVIAVSEFYQLPDEILSEVRASQTRGWTIVAVATLIMFVVLNGMVRQASATIRRQHTGLRRLHEQVRAASASNVQTEEQVMSRIAQDLHDGPAQDLAVALLHLRSSSSTSAGQVANWPLIRESVAGALEELRHISSDIRIPELDGLDAEAVVSQAVADFSRRTGRPVSCRTETAGVALSAAAKATVYRILQEALNNSFLHGQAAVQAVSAALRNGWLELEIADDGVGFDPALLDQPGRWERARLGIRGMRERAELLGGSFSVQSRPGRGTRVFARIPVGQGTA